jgi:hypothetical protein
MSPDRVYTIAEIRTLLKVSPTTFKRMRRDGALPFLEELRPRLGRSVRYRAEPVDRYLAGAWGRPHLAFGRRAGR